MNRLKRLMLATLAFGYATTASAEWPEDPKPTREQCYVLVGAAFAEDGVITTLSKDENGFVVKLDKEKWASVSDLAKRALKTCVDEFHEPPPTPLSPE